MNHRSGGKESTVHGELSACVAGGFVWRARKWAAKLRKRANEQWVFPAQSLGVLSWSGDVTTHGRVQEWSSRKRLGTRLGFFIFVPTSKRALSIQPKRSVWIFGNYQTRMQQHFLKFPKTGQPCKVCPNFRKKFSRKFSFHSTLLPEKLEHSVEWFAFWKFNIFQNFWKLFREISVPVCRRFQVFEKFWFHGKRTMSPCRYHNNVKWSKRRFLFLLQRVHDLFFYPNV